MSKETDPLAAKKCPFVRFAPAPVAGCGLTRAFAGGRSASFSVSLQAATSWEEEQRMKASESNAQAKGMHYGRFALMIVTSTIIMFGLQDSTDSPIKIF